MKVLNIYLMGICLPGIVVNLVNSEMTSVYYLGDQSNGIMVFLSYKKGAQRLPLTIISMSWTCLWDQGSPNHEDRKTHSF